MDKISHNVRTGRKMNHQKKSKVPFRRSCFEEALHLRHTSIRKLGDVSTGIGWSEKTIRRALEAAEISPELLDVIAKRLDVDPDYLSGKYHHQAEQYSDPYIRNFALCNLKVERFPYLLQQKRNKVDGQFLYDRYLECLLIIHDISLKQFNDLTFEVRKKLQIEIEAAICPVLMKFFEKDALGRDTWPEIYRLQNEIEEYDPDFVEPPESCQDFESDENV